MEIHIRYQVVNFSNDSNNCKWSLNFVISTLSVAFAQKMIAFLLYLQNVIPPLATSIHTYLFSYWWPASGILSIFVLSPVPLSSDFFHPPIFMTHVMSSLYFLFKRTFSSKLATVFLGTSSSVSDIYSTFTMNISAKKNCNSFFLTFTYCGTENFIKTLSYQAMTAASEILHIFMCFYITISIFSLIKLYYFINILCQEIYFSFFSCEVSDNL